MVLTFRCHSPTLALGRGHFVTTATTRQFGNSNHSLWKRIHVHVSPDMELKQIHTLTEMDACTCTVPLYMYVHVHVYQNNVNGRID